MLERGRIVLSKAGRDKDEFLVVVGSEGKYLFLADGKGRKLENPKKKKAMHVGLTATVLSEAEIQTDKKIRKALNAYSAKEKKAYI